MLEFSVATITVFVGLLNQLVKFISKTYFKFDIKKYIPLFSIGFGLILGIAGFFMPNVDMGNNIIEAIFIGIASGCAATGVHQVGKQLGLTSPSIVEEDIDIPTEELMEQINDVVDTIPEEEIDESDEDYNEDE